MSLWLPLIPTHNREFCFMYTGNFIVSQVMAHLPMPTSPHCVQCYHNHHNVKTLMWSEIIEKN